VVDGGTLNVKPAGPSVMRSVAYAVSALIGVALMTACGAQGDDEAGTSSAPPPATSAGVEESVAADDSMTDDTETGEALSEDGSDIEIFAYAYASGKDPAPTWELEDKVVVFTFPSGSLDENSSYDCLIAVNVFAGDNPDWDLKMTYPDGSVLCSEMDM
jgi:hypothetical protein